MKLIIIIHDHLRLQFKVRLHQMCDSVMCFGFPLTPPPYLCCFFTLERICKLENWEGLLILFSFYLSEGTRKTLAASCWGVNELCVQTIKK